MSSIILNEVNIKQLDSYLQEMPVKYGLPIINFLNSLSAEQEHPVTESEIVEDKSTKKSK